MRIIILLLIIILGCKDRKQEDQLAKVQQINSLIEGKRNKLKACYQDSFFEKSQELISRDTGIERGKFVVVDTFVTSFFCDSLGQVSMSSTVFGRRSGSSYQTYFSKNNIIKVVELFNPVRSEQLDISEYYIESDTVFFKREGEHYYSDMKSWISFIKAANKNFDPTKAKR